MLGLDTTLRQFEHEKEELRHQIEIFEEILIGYQVIKMQIMDQCRVGSGKPPTFYSCSGDGHQSRYSVELFQQSALAALALLQSGGPDAIPAIKKLMENLLQ
uniref:Bm12560, isoform a n=1 Tax=Brugia malayi TaxID=6279 RepID=A0A1I9G955_BRUMA|nr:Bm12560, isoform a [Brugia malayi]